MTLGLAAVILAGGLGTRLGALGAEKPKALLEIAGAPFLHWKIEELIKQGVTGIYLLTGHRGDQIYDFVSANKYSIPVSIIPDGVSPLGTARSLVNALPLIIGEQFILTYGDNLLELGIGDFCGKALSSGKSLMVVTSNLGLADTPNARVEGDSLVEYSKGGKPGLSLVDYGYSVIAKKDLIDLEAIEEEDLAPVFTKMAREGRLLAYATDLGYLEIGTPDSFRKTEEYLRSKTK